MLFSDITIISIIFYRYIGIYFSHTSLSFFTTDQKGNHLRVVEVKHVICSATPLYESRRISTGIVDDSVTQDVHSCFHRYTYCREIIA